MRLSHFARTVYRLERELAPESWRQLEMSIRLFEEAFPEVTLQNVTHSILNQWALDNPRRWAPKTMRRRMADIISIVKHGCRTGHRRQPLARDRIRRIRGAKRVPEAWSLDECRLILQACESFHDYLPNGVPRGQLLRSTFCVGFYSALRPADLFALRRDQLSSEGMPIRQAKKRGTELLVRVPDWVKQEINQRYPEAVERVVAWPFCKKYWYDVWRDLLMRAHLRATKRDGLQKLRRTAVSHGEAIRMGYGAQLAGHVPGSAVTYESYADPRIVQAQEILLPDLREVG